MTPVRKSVYRGLPTSWMRSTARPASTIIMMILPASEGWRLKGPISIHRLDPLTALPSTNTIASAPSRPPHSAQAQRARRSRLTRVATIISTTPIATKRIWRSRK